MPYVSDAQRRWAHTKKGQEALGGPSGVAEWDAASKGMNLPERVGARRKAAKPIAEAMARKGMKS